MISLPYTIKAARRIPAALSAAFSLIEVNMAILVVAGGLFTLISIFPSGLRLSVSALSDTRQAFFASDLLNTIHANLASDPYEFTGDPIPFPMDKWLNFNDVWMNITRNRNGFSNLPGAKSAPGVPISSSDIYARDPAVIADAQNNFKKITTQGFLHIYYAQGELKGYLGSNTSTPLRYAIRIARYASSVDPNALRQSKNYHLDPLTWRFSVASMDQPFGKIWENTIYHLEVRYQPTALTLTEHYPLSIIF